MNDHMDNNNTGTPIMPSPGHGPDPGPDPLFMMKNVPTSISGVIMLVFFFQILNVVILLPWIIKSSSSSINCFQGAGLDLIIIVSRELD